MADFIYWLKYEATDDLIDIIGIPLLIIGVCLVGWMLLVGEVVRR